MNWLRFAVFVLIAAVLQASKLLDMIAFTQLNIKPDLLLILLVFFAIHCRTYEAIIISFVLGFAADITGSLMGTYTMSFGLFGSLLACVRSVIMIKKMLHQSIAIFTTGFLSGIFVHLLAILKGYPNTSGAVWFLFGSSLYSAVIGPYICSLLPPVARWMSIKKYRFGESADR